jgi:two-component system, LuxR family, response regulator FixJ
MRALMQNQDRIFVVDADAAVRSSLKFSLGVEGFATRDYPDATSFLREADLSDPRCIVIIDFDLPDMTGLEVLDTLRRRGITVGAILVASIATPTLCKRAAAFKAPVVEKPFSDDQLMDAIRATFAR